MSLPSQKILVDRFLDWRKVESRLAKYPHIASHFPLELLRRCCDQPPYYCHYISFRLGAWYNEQPLQLFDELLAHAESLENWGSESHLMSDCSFDQYWGLLWQLQLAKMLSVLGCQVSWMSSGPDLCVVIGKDCFYVECYSFRKSFGTGEFIRELMARIDPNLAIDHRWWTPYSLPKDNKLGPFLDDLFLPLLDPSYIARLRLQAESKYPVHLPVPEVAKNFNLFMKGEDTSKYDPALRTLSSGIPEDYLVVAFREALGNKRSSNKLSAHRPNLLAVNFLLSEDFQGAFIRQRDLRLPSPSLDFGDELDGVLYSACGINMVPSKSGVFVEYNVSNHPARAILA